MRVNFIKTGISHLELKCNQELLKKFVDEYIDSVDYPFTFKLLCSHIKLIAEQKDLFIKEPNTEYSNIELGSKTLYDINLIINDYILDRKLMIYFSSECQRPNNEVNFIKIE